MKKNIEFFKSKIGISIMTTILIVGIGTGMFIYNNTDKSIKNNKCVIQFDTNGGSKINAQEIICGSIIKKPNNPTKDGFEFDNWFFNDKLFDFNSKVNDDIVIRASWKELDNVEYIEVSFDSNGGTPVNKIKIIKGGKITSPSVPSKKDYKFIGWFLNDIRFDFNSNLTENILLTAKWEKEKNTTVKDDYNSNKNSKTENNTKSNKNSNTDTTEGKDDKKQDNNSKTETTKNTISVSTSNINVYVGTSENFTVTYTPENVDAWSIGCMSGNDSVAHVQGNGKNTYNVSGVSAGTTSIVCENTNGGLAYRVYKRINVNVSVAPVTGLDTTIITNIEVGQQIQIQSSVIPNYAGNKGISYSSSNPSVVSISSSGVISGNSVGTASITIITNEGGFTKKFNVNVIEPRIVQKVRITCSSSGMSCPMNAHVGETYNLIASVYPIGTSTITWSSSRPEVATVDQNGNVTIISTGETHIYATANANPNIRGIWSVNVSN